MSDVYTVDGTILNLIFQNEENGYTVLRLVTTDGEVVTVVGTIPCAAPGESLVVTGQWMTHPVHGEQLQAQQVERYMPTTENDILSYLSSGVIKGVGPATAEKLVQRFGSNTLGFWRRSRSSSPRSRASPPGRPWRSARATVPRPACGGSWTF